MPISGEGWLGYGLPHVVRAHAGFRSVDRAVAGTAEGSVDGTGCRSTRGIREPFRPVSLRASAGPPGLGFGDGLVPFALFTKPSPRIPVPLTRPDSRAAPRPVLTPHSGGVIFLLALRKGS